MKYTKLGHSDIEVSRICLGTMTWGEQNTQAQGFAQMNFALDKGVNFWDTAELYSIPPKPDTCGSTETIIGNWLAKTGRRHDIVLASKVAGPAEFVSHIREGKTRFNRETMTKSLNDSLARLQTDYLDLYQLHWPERPTNFFGQLGFEAPNESAAMETQLRETLSVLSDFVKQGKIRHIGLSNETAWGAMTFLNLAKQTGLEKIVTIQNPYSLLNRSYEVGLAEVSHREGVGLLAYSPLGFGVLSGKYLKEPWPADARLSLFDSYHRYKNPNADKATALYAALANGFGLSPATLALAYVNSRPFVTANIIGATNLTQLAENIASINVTLPDEALEQIERIHNQYVYPCP